MDAHLRGFPTPFGGVPEDLAATLTGAALKKRVSRAGRKAGGADGWLPRHMALLPDPCFEALATLWRRVLAGAPVPAAWAAVRVCLIPKHDGTDNRRPIGVASIAWRAGMGVLVHSLSPWMEEWLDEDISSGPHRDANRTLDAVIEELDDAKAGGEAFFGGNIDLSKCFDRCYWERSLRILTAFGLPPGVAHVLRDFYRQRVMYLEVQGCVAAPLRCVRGLLQGCPGSVMLLLADMTVFAAHIRAQCPAVRVGIFADDRTLWSRGPQANLRCDHAARVARLYDAGAGWVWNAGKGATFSTGNLAAGPTPGCEELGPPAERVVLLGVTLDTTGEGPTVRQARAEVAVKQLHRLGLACPGATLWPRRAKFVRTLIVPKLAWAGRFQRPPLDTMRKWDAAIQRVVLQTRGASRAAVWEVIGAYCSVECALHLDSLRHEVWRLREVATGRVGAGGERHGWVDAAARLGWSPERLWRGVRGPPARYVTPFGKVDLTRDGRAAVEGCLRRSWLRTQWLREPRGADASSRDLLAKGMVASGLRQFASLGGRAHLRAATGATLNRFVVGAVSTKAGPPARESGELHSPPWAGNLARTPRR